jgi:hypothetical protein
MSEEETQKKPFPLINIDGANVTLERVNIITGGDGVHLKDGKLKTIDTKIITGGDGIVVRKDHS